MAVTAVEVVDASVDPASPLVVGIPTVVARTAVGVAMVAVNTHARTATDITSPLRWPPTPRPKLITASPGRPS
jgi:hypothetical protein